MRVHLGCDHAGLDLKDHLTRWLTEHGYEPVDHGPFQYDALDDYPVFCLRAAEGVAHERAGGMDSLANVIAVGGRMHSLEDMTRFVEIFLAEPFSNDERHVRRIGLMADYEQTRVL